MKKHLLLFILILLPSILKAETLHTVSFNLHCTFENWEARVDEVAQQLAKARPDFIAFQEVCLDTDNDMANGILQALARHGYPVVSHQTQFSHFAWDKYDEYLMVISRHRIQEVQKGFLPKSPLQRSYLGAKINGIWFVNVHLEHSKNYAQYRDTQVQFLVNKFRDRRHIIMGDFNSEVVSPEQSHFLKQNYVSFFPGFTRPANKPTMAIDGLWISPELGPQLKDEKARLIFKELFRGNYLSDHLGVSFKATLQR